MELTPEDIDTFADIWEKEFDERLSPDDARIEAGLLLELCWLLVHPLPHEDGYAAPPLITL